MTFWEPNSIHGINRPGIRRSASWRSSSSLRRADSLRPKHTKTPATAATDMGMVTTPTTQRTAATTQAFQRTPRFWIRPRRRSLRRASSEHRSQILTDHAASQFQWPGAARSRGNSEVIGLPHGSRKGFGDGAFPHAGQGGASGHAAFQIQMACTGQSPRPARTLIAGCSALQSGQYTGGSMPRAPVDPRRSIPVAGNRVNG